MASHIWPNPPTSHTPSPQVFRQGDPGDSFYVVEDGTFSITNEEGAEVAKCSKGQCFGELALLRQEARCGGVGWEPGCVGWYLRCSFCVAAAGCQLGAGEVVVGWLVGWLGPWLCGSDLWGLNESN